MGWQIEFAKLLNKGSKASKVPKIRFEGLGSLGTRFSSWIQGTKFSSWVKAGLAGGVGYTIYHAWGSSITAIADATGLSESTVESLLFAVIGIMVAYIAARLLVPGNGSTVVVGSGSSARRPSGSRGRDGSKRRRRSCISSSCLPSPRL